MKSKSIPVLWGSSMVLNHKTIFDTFGSEVVADIPGSVMRDVLNLCNGQKNITEVVGELSKKWDKEIIVSFLERLFREKVIVDGRNLVEEFWRVITNPMLFPVSISKEKVSQLVSRARDRHQESCERTYRPTLGNLASLIAQRKSVRLFSGEQISLQAIVDMLWSAYGEYLSGSSFHRTIPSAGALYPLVIHIGLFQQTGVLESGIYKVCYSQSGSVGFKFLSGDISKFARAFLNPAGIQKGIHGVIVISGSFSVSNQKYGNRSMLYTILEAGHSAQNVLIEATRQGAATLEIGGFVDELLTDSIDLSKGYHPLTLIAFGKEEKQSNSNETSTIEIDWAVPMGKNYKPEFAIASVRLSPKRSWSHGRDLSPEMALEKAISEAKEWTSWPVCSQSGSCLLRGIRKCY